MFTGFYPETSDFLIGLSFNNERPWFEAHRPEFTQYLKEPFKALAEDTTALMAEAYPDTPLHLHIARIHRDVRRAHGKGPYKDHLWFSLKGWPGLLTGPTLWFEVGGLEYAWGMGYYSAKAAEMDFYRKQVAEHPRRFARIVKELEKYPEYQLTGDLYKRPKMTLSPKLDPWVNRKNIGLSVRKPFGPELLDDSLPGFLCGEFGKLLPLYRFLGESYLDYQAASLLG